MRNQNKIYTECPKCGKSLTKYYSDETKTKTFAFCPFCGSELEEEHILNNDIQSLAYDWLSRHLKIDKELVTETVKNQIATVFLLIWPIIEDTIFNSRMGFTRKQDLSKEVSDYISLISLEDIAFHFYDRFQTKEFFDGLNYRESTDDKEKAEIERILSKSFFRLTEYEKTLLCLSVVYRYRNNIFHGTKKITKWKDFKKEIECCIRFMIIFSDAHDRYKRINPVLPW